MNSKQNSVQEVKGKRYVLYLPVSFESAQNNDIMKKVMTVAKKLFRGATFSPPGIGAYVSRNSTGEFKEYEESVRTIEVITRDIDEPDSKIEQFGYAVLCALEEKRPKENPEKVIWFTEQDIVLHEIQNPEFGKGGN